MLRPKSRKLLPGSGGRLFSLQGYEPQFLSTTLKTVDLDRIYSGREIPKFWYKIDNVKRSYTPDFIILSEGNSTDEIIEVKSTWTLGLTRPYEWKKVLLKGRSVEKEGFKFRLALTDALGNVCFIPNFTSKSRSELQKHLKRKGII